MVTNWIVRALGEYDGGLSINVDFVLGKGW